MLIQFRRQYYFPKRQRVRINWHAVEKIDKEHSFNDMAVLFFVRTAVVVSHKI